MRGARTSLLLAMAIAAVMLFARLGQLPLRDPDEGRNAEVAREMAEAGAWLTPTYNGLVYLDKPAFYFKAVAISFRVFGESEWAARLPSALFAVGILAMVFRFCRKEYDELTARLAIIVVASTPSFFALARHVIFDMTLAFFMVGAIFAGYLAEATEGSRRRNWYLLAAVSAGAGTLVKGPVGFLVPAFVLSVFNIVDRRSGCWKRLFHPLNFLVFFGVTLPWFFGLSHQHPDFPRYGLIEESFNRFTTGSFSRKAPFYYYGLVVLGGLFAWSVLLPEAARSAWRARARWSRADRLLIVWAIVVVVFFSISKSKLPHYILTALVALGILTARLFAEAFRNREGAAAQVVLRSLVFLVILSAAVAAFLVVNIAMPGAALTIFKIKSKEFGRIALAFPSAAIMMILLCGVAFAGRWLRDVRLAFAAFLVIPLSLLTIGFHGLVTYSEASSSRELARRIPSLPAGTEVVCLQCFPCGLPFYLKRPVTVISASGQELTSNYILYSLRHSATWPPTIVPLADEEKWLASRRHAVFIIANDRRKPALYALATRRNQTVVELTPGWWGLFLS